MRSLTVLLPSGVGQTVLAQRSQRGRQRAIALYLGRQGRTIEARTLWATMAAHGLSGHSVVANRAQNMRKDAACFVGDPVDGWRLTPHGEACAQDLLTRTNASSALDPSPSACRASSAFDVAGPLPVPFGIGRTGVKGIEPQHGVEFWIRNPHLAARRGCYVFGVRRGRALVPWYVGRTRAAKGFRGEVFTDHKLRIFASVLRDVVRGTPVLFLVHRTGRVVEAELDAMERYLIVAAHEANAALMNRRGVPAWTIHGVTTGARRSTSPARALREMLHLTR